MWKKSQAKPGRWKVVHSLWLKDGGLCGQERGRQGLPKGPRMGLRVSLYSWGATLLQVYIGWGQTEHPRGAHKGERCTGCLFQVYIKIESALAHSYMYPAPEYVPATCRLHQLPCQRETDARESGLWGGGQGAKRGKRMGKTEEKWGRGRAMLKGGRQKTGR